MLSFIIAHLMIGILLGTWLRFGALFPAFFLVILEAVLAAQLGVMIPAYFLILAGIFALQLGYAGASYFKAIHRPAAREAGFRHAAQEAGQPSLSTPK
jgi:hypothetical protein